MSTIRQVIKLRAFVVALLAELEASARARHVRLDALVFSEELEADAGVLRLLLTSLVTGALQRAPAGTNVSLVVSPRDGYTEFRVADEGAGIAVELRDNVLQAGAGASRNDGAGLTFGKLSAEANGGRLSVVETNNGTVVCLAFPSGVGPAASRPSGEGEAARGPATTFGPRLARSDSGIYERAAGLASLVVGPTILVVDDEPLIRTFVVRALKDVGYNAVEAGGAEQALEILKTLQHRIALLLTDVGLPGASGIELVRQARGLDPELPTLLMSATPRHVLRGTAGLEAGTYLLEKPFVMADLLAKLAELLPPSSRRAPRRAVGTV